MTSTRVLSLALLAFIGLAQAQTQSTPATNPTRAQIEAEAQAARKAGDLPTGDLDKKPMGRYPKAPVTSASTLTRAQVAAEAVRARRAGETPIGELGETPREVNPKRYPAVSPSAGATRAQVKAEAKAAERAGDTQVGELGKTKAELDAPRYAGAPASAPRLHFPHRKAKAAPAASATIN